MALLFVGCENPVTPPGTDDAVAAVAVTAPAATLQTGASMQLSAAASNAAGQALTGKTFVWASSSDAVATVASDGTVTGRSPGPVTITATSEGRSGSVELTVLPVPIATVSVSPDTATLLVGATRQLTALARDASGGALTGRPVTWSSADSLVASVSTTGLVTARAAGSAVITATSEGKTGTATIAVGLVPIATVSVSPDTATLVAGATRQLMAVGRDASGGVLTGRPVTWSSADPEIASVSTLGLVTAHAAGSAAITATSEGKSGTATITVTPVPIATVTVSPDTATLMVGATRQLMAVGWDASGGVLTGRPVAWSSADSLVASVSPTGLITAHAAGSAVITATSEGKSGTAAITVVPVPIATVSVSPDTATLFVGATRQLMAVGRDASGGVLTGRAVTWASADPAIASVSATGLVTAHAPGSVAITATSEGKSGTASITVKPTTATLRIGITSQGDLPDPDGYEILYNGQSMGKFGGTGGMVADNLQPGEYTVAIRSVSLYCGVNGSRDRTVTLTAGETTEVDFVVQCRRDGLAYIIYDGSRSWNYVHFPGRDTVQIPPVSVVGGSRMRWSPDGRRLLYTSALAVGGATSPTYVDLDSLREVRLPVTGIQPDPSPDGTRIAYANVSAIRTMGWDGSDVTTVWESGSTSIYAQMPTWSPDGRRIAFIKSDFTSGTGVAYIMVVNADGTGERVVRTLRSVPYLHIDWSPDGSRIVYSDRPPGTLSSIYTADVATGTETLLIGATGTDYVHPEYLRDGRIGFITRLPGPVPNTRVWTMNADGTGLTERIIPGVTGAWIPAWQ